MADNPPRYSLRVMKRKLDGQHEIAQDEPPKKRKTNAQYQREYRQRVKQNRTLYKLHCASENLRVKEYLSNLTEEKKAQYRETTRLRVRKFRQRNAAVPNSSKAKKAAAPKTRLAKEAQRSKWRRQKQNQRAKQTAQAKRMTNEKRRAKYAEKKKRTSSIKSTPPLTHSSEAQQIPVSISSGSFRKAVYRAKQAMPKNSRQYAEVLTRLIHKATPTKKQQLKEKGISASPRSRRFLQFAKESCGNIKDAELGINKQRNTSSLHRKRVLAADLPENASRTPQEPADRQLTAGDIVVVAFEDAWYPGAIKRIISDELAVTYCMDRPNKNKQSFVWEKDLTVNRKFILCVVNPSSLIPDPSLRYFHLDSKEVGFIPEDGNARNVRVSPLTPASFEVKWDGSPTSCDVIGYSIYYSKENTSSSEEFTTVYGGDIRTAKIDVTAVTQDTVYLVYVAGLNWLSVLDRIGPARVTLTPESDNREYISVTGDSGDIQSPGWPTSYENNKDITWTITVSKPGRVRLTILSIRLDSNGDYLTVGSGGTSGLNELGRYTGYQENVGYLESQFNQMWLRFITDSTKTAQGFSVEFAKVDDGTVDDCGRSFTDIASGFINSPNYLEGMPYPNNLDCVWKIKLQDQTALVKLDFINFDVERDHDFLTIGSGLTVNENILKWMTGKLDPPISSIVSPTNEMWLRFLSDESQGSRGFRAEFTSQEGSPPTTPVYETADTLLFIVKNENVAWFDAVNQVQLKSTIAEVLNRYEIPAQQEIKQKIQGNFDASDVVFVRFYDVDSDLHIVTWVHDASSIDPKVPLNPEMVIQAVTAEKEYFQSSMGESFEYEMRLPTTPVPTVPTSSLPDWAIAVIAVGSLSILIVLGLFIFGCSKIGGDHSSLKKEVQIQLGDENGSFRPTSFGSDGTWNPAFHSIMDESEELASDTGL